MRLFHSFAAGLKDLFRRDAAERDLDAELRSYMDHATADKVRGGATAEEAAREARLEMDGLETVKHKVRSVGWEFSLETLIQDVRYGVRMLRKSPSFTLVALAAIALGIGANTAIFSVVNAILLQPLPYPDPDRLIMAGTHERHLSGIHAMGVADFLAWRDHQKSLEHVAFFDQVTGVSLSGLGEPEQIRGVRVNSEFFSTLGISPLKGRGFISGEDRPGNPGVAVVSERFWRDHLNSDPAVLGRSITLNGKPYQIVGVMPAGFRFPSWSPLEVWIIRTLNPPEARPPFGLLAFGRLKPGVTPQAAQAELNTIVDQVSKQYPDSAELVGETMPMKGWLVQNVSTALFVLLGAITLVLIIAVVNVANLMLARATVRRREISVRMALGATRKRILRQLLTESLVLSITGGVLGILLAWLAMRAFLAFGPGDLPRLEEVGINGTVLLFTVIVCVGSGVTFGLAPAFETSRTSADEGLKETSRTSPGASAHRLHNALVITEVAIALLLMIGSGLLVRSFVRLRAVDPGIRRDHLISARITLSRSYDSPDQIRNFWKQFSQRVESTPGVHAAGISMSIPPNLLAITNPFTVEGQGYDRNRPLQLAEEMTVSSGYFRAAGIPLRKGRLFTAEDKVEGKNAQHLLIINETMAKKFFPNQDPVGRRIQTGDPDPKSPWETIVGVVGDVKYSGLDAPPAPTLYVPFNDEGWVTWSTSMYLLVQTEADSAGIVPALRAQLASMDRNLPLARVKTMDRVLGESVVQERFRAWLVGSFAAIALLLATIGIYGVISYSVSQRTREIGVRMALGALRADVLKLVLSQGLRLLAVGLILGIIGSLLATRLMGSLLFGIKPTDLVSYGAMSLVLCFVALLACFIPARRAMKVEPTVALRYE